MSRALNRLKLIYKKQLRSPAVGFEGIVLGAEEPRDMNARLIRDAIGMFKLNPQAAVSQGVTNEDGQPLDTRATWA